MRKIDLPDWIDPAAWAGYLEMRKLIRKPATDRAQDLSIQYLRGLRDAGQNVNEVLDQSTQRSWQGLFPVKGAPVATPATADPDAEAHRAWIELRQSRAHERKVEWSDPRIPEVLRVMGGPQAIADMRTDQVSFRQREFVQLFKAIRPSKVVQIRRSA